MKNFRRILIVTVILLSILSKIFIGEICTVPTPSMEPTINSGDCMWIDKITYGARFPQRWGDIPVINIFTWIKPLRVADEKNNWRYLRVWRIKEPQIGDMVVFNSPNDNNILLVKRITKINSNTINLHGQKQKVYFVEGDNKDNSIDSRSFGYISESSIVGKVNRVLFSIDHSDKSFFNFRKDRFFKKIKN